MKDQKEKQMQITPISVTFFRAAELLIIQQILKRGLSNKEELQEAIASFKQEKTKNVQKELGGFLIEKNIISSNDLEQIILQDDLGKKLKEDNIFSHIAIKNGYVKQNQIQGALKIQADIFSKTSKLKSIGEILLESKIILQEQYDAITSRQNIQEVENKSTYFGNIAVQKNFITQEQLEEIILLQHQIFEGEGKIKLLGELLVEKGIITKNQRTEIIGFQKKLRFPNSDFSDDEESKAEEEENKQKNEEPESKEETVDYTQESEVQITVSPPLFGVVTMKVFNDQSEVYIKARKKIPEYITPDDIKQILEKNGIVYGIVPDEEIQKYIKDAELQKLPFKIAQGEVPIFTKDDEIICHFETKNKSVGKETDQGSVDYKDRGEIPMVMSGDILIERIPGVKGEKGCNVYGKVTETREYEKLYIKAGKGAKLADNGNIITALVTGMPVIDKLSGRVEVFQEFRVKGDINMETGNINYPGTVIASGFVESGFNVKAGRLKAQGIMGGEVETSIDLTLSAGIVGAKVISKGKVYAKFVKTSKVTSTDNVTIERDIVGSDIKTSGECRVQNGKIVSSEIASLKGIVAKQIGTPTSLACTLQIGVDAVNKEKLDLLEKEISEKKESLNELEEVFLRFEQELEKNHMELIQTSQNQESLKNSLTQLMLKIKQIKKKDVYQKATALAKQLGEQLKETIQQKEKMNQNIVTLEEGMLDFDVEQLRQVEDLKKEIEKLEIQRDKILAMTKTDVKKPASIVVTGPIYRNTTIIGPVAKMELKHDYKDINIKESVKFTEDGEPESKLVIAQNRQ